MDFLVDLGMVELSYSSSNCISSNYIYNLYRFLSIGHYLLLTAYFHGLVAAQARQQEVAVLARKQEATPMAVNHSPVGYQPTTQIQAHKP